jgi:hypothetical protein
MIMDIAFLIIMAVVVLLLLMMMMVTTMKATMTVMVADKYQFRFFQKSVTMSSPS